MKVFYNFDNMYSKNKPRIITNCENNSIDSIDNMNDINFNSFNKEEKENKEDEEEESEITVNISNYDLDKNVALFDYSAKATSRYLSKQSCSNVNCLEGLADIEVPDNCMDYNGCLQYFNTMPIMNCLDNVPTASFLILAEQ